jgi:molybdate transport system substrate-binding protein
MRSAARPGGDRRVAAVVRGPTTRALVALIAVVALALAGCGSTGPRGEASLTVFAAASLKTPFDQLRASYLEQHPDVDFPEINYDGSSTLVEQIRQGAPADVIASADETNMDEIADLVTGRIDFATNSLRIAVAPGNPKHITSLADLAKDGVVTVICAPEVPCGAASRAALDAAGVTLRPASEEESVKAVLTKVASGDADAGLVYATDVNTSGGAVMGVDFPEAARAVNTYPIAVLADSHNRAAAQAFVDLVTGEKGRRVLAAVGFGGP